MLDITIDNKKYEYITQINYNGKDYVAYADDDNIFISEYILDNDKVTLKEIDSNLLDIIAKEMGL